MNEVHSHHQPPLKEFDPSKETIIKIRRFPNHNSIGVEFTAPDQPSECNDHVVL